MFLHIQVTALMAALRVTRRLGDKLRTPGVCAGERGQTTAEYALVLLGAASVALLVAMWARGDDGVGKLLDAVFGKIIKLVR